MTIQNKFNIHTHIPININYFTGNHQLYAPQVTPEVQVCTL